MFLIGFVIIRVINYLNKINEKYNDQHNNNFINLLKYDTNKYALNII